MSWLDALRDRANESRVTVPAVPTAKPRREPKPEIKSVWFQTRVPMNGDAGAVEAGFYSVSDGVLTMHDAKGTPGKQYRLGPDEDPRQIAARLAKEAWSKEPGDFWRRIDYGPPLSVV